MTTKTRKPVSTKTRFEVFKRDGFVCQYCGDHPPNAVLHVDHIDPVANGGTNDFDNLITACEVCNMGKGARVLSDAPISLKDKAADVAEREEQLRGYQEVLEGKRQRIEDEAWRVAHVLMQNYSKDSVRRDYLTSIKNFVEKLGVHECLDSMEKAVSKKGRGGENGTFTYFCGICWNKIKSR